MFGYILRADCQRCTFVPPFNTSANAAPVSVQALPVRCPYSAGTDVGRGSLETADNRVLNSMCLTWDELFFLDGWACLGINLLDIPTPTQTCAARRDSVFLGLHAERLKVFKA